MILDVLELVFGLLYVLARIAGTVAIVYLILKHMEVDFGSCFLIFLVVLIGMGFDYSYTNPHNPQPPAEQVKELK